MGRLAIALCLLTMTTGCALETHSVGSGNGGLDVDGVEFGASDGGVDDGGLETTPPDATSSDTTATDMAVTDTTVTDTTVTDTTVTDTTVTSDATFVVEPTCTPGTERSSCPGTSCDPVTLTCTRMELASRDTCETCFTDSNCASMDERCVWMTYQGEPFPDERMGFCLKVTEPVTLDGGYACEPPFIVPLANRESPSGGMNQTYCGIQEKITTCFAVRAFHNQEVCPSGRDDECPAGGLCRAVATNGNKTEFVCTYACTEDAECSNPASKVSCGGYCGG